MKEKPILFSTEMVIAILEGRKTMTRRVMKTQPHIGRYGNGEIIRDDYFCLGNIPLTEDCKYRWIEKCPYGQVGDLLWVRETWATIANGYGIWEVYRASTQTDFVNGAKDIDQFMKFEGLKWNPSIHMPKYANRITLEITNIRVERLQDISRADIEAEGIQFPKSRQCGENKTVAETYFDEFCILWDKINGKRKGCAWKDNPWLWVVEFKRIFFQG